MTVEIWWNTNKDSILWSGAIIGLSWDDLWDTAKVEVLKLYTSAMNNDT